MNPACIGGKNPARDADISEMLMAAAMAMMQAQSQQC